MSKAGKFERASWLQEGLSGMQSRRLSLAAVVVAVMCCCGCRCTPQPQALSLFPDNLMGDAHRTYAAYVRASHAGAELTGPDIPPTYWTDRIKALHPLKVYTHRVNIVVVQKVVGDVEQGKYINIPVSSYFPMTGTDGFTFTPTKDTGVFDFKRSTEKSKTSQRGAARNCELGCRGESVVWQRS